MKFIHPPLQFFRLSPEFISSSLISIRNALQSVRSSLSHFQLAKTSFHSSPWLFLQSGVTKYDLKTEKNNSKKSFFIVNVLHFLLSLFRLPFAHPFLPTLLPLSPVAVCTVKKREGVEENKLLTGTSPY